MILHIVTEAIAPSLGGLEKHTLALAKGFRRLGNEVIVHLRSPNQGFDEASDGIEITRIASEVTIWDEPLRLSNWPVGRLQSERWRLERLVLRNLISRYLCSSPSTINIVVSTFATSSGFLAQMVSRDLQLVHVACVVGTDFSRGFVDPQERSRLASVVEGATKVVTNNHEQERMLKRDFQVNDITTIHTSVEGGSGEMRSLRQPSPSDLTLFSDCGYSHKKGTHVLMWAFAQLRAQGRPISLTICGHTEQGQSDYWAEKGATLELQHPGMVSLRDYVDDSEVRRNLQTADIYCSATLGEGCSLGRVAALCSGIPVVTTCTGEIPDVMNGASHVRVSHPCDAAGFHLRLQDLIDDLLAGHVIVDESLVNAWKTHFMPKRELAQWKQVLDACSGADV